MDLHNKKILVVGLKKTGLAVIEALIDLSAADVSGDAADSPAESFSDLEILAYDGKDESQLPAETTDLLKANNIQSYLGREPENLDKLDLIVTSPGVPLDIPLLKKAADLGVEIIGEVELAYRLGKGRFIGITGTNGKTTTTALIGAILKEGGFKTEVVGNIGDPVIEKALKADEDTWLVTELSSFQLETTRDFHPEIALLLNISPDHLDRHGSLDKYIEAKKKIFANQKAQDYFIYNYDDPRCKEIAGEVPSKALGFSGTRQTGIGTFVDRTEGQADGQTGSQADSQSDGQDPYIMLADQKGTIHKICPVAKLKIKGHHNLENALAATAAGFFAGVDIKQIEKALENFPGVVHRLEDLGEINGISFINDSKGTNTDSSIKALQAIKSPIILIAGGYDKSADYEDFINAFDGKVKALILIGETAQAIQKTAIEQGFKEIYLEKDMEKAVTRAYSLGEKGDTVLLSPACASWDMYENFEQRGDDFRSKVEDLRQD